MKSAKPLFLMIAILLVNTVVVAQTEEARISALREASNLALKAYDNEKVLSFLTDDVLTTTGNGTLLAGKEALRAYIAEAGASKMYWVRSPKEITVNAQNGLAWETGIWNGYDPEKGPDAVVGGNYSAMWTKASGSWKIKSQLFVALR
jgi:uncharacterized protein (TIGR02246 family)